MIMFALLYVYLRYHEALLEKFPLEEKINDDNNQSINKINT